MPESLTTRSTPSEAEDASRRCIAVRILAHPDPTRVGELSPLFDAGGEGTVEIGRSVPEFRTIQGRASGPLGSSRITRTPLSIELRAGRVSIRHPSASTRVEINGEPLRGERVLDPEALKLGIVILFGNYLTVVIGYLELIDVAMVAPNMIGDSTAMRALRQEIQRIAAVEVPVLLRGETGVGKELVAGALHALGPRAPAPYVAVNVASIPPNLAASELFGHRRGAFSGATEDHKGYFSQAHGGTLFLDEIGEIDSGVQAALLRAVETGVIQPLGGRTAQVDVRLIAATDSNLEAAIAKQEFREPLLRRFSYEIWVPPLRARRDDIGLLLIHFLRERLGSAQATERLDRSGPDPEPWIPAPFVAELALHHWPGNIRELSNVALRFAVENRDRKVGRISDGLRALLKPGPVLLASEPSALARTLPVRASTLSDGELVAAMRAAHFQREKAAKTLGISKSYLYRRLAGIPEIRALGEIPTAEVVAALEAASGNLTQAAAALEVSDRALKIHLKRQTRTPKR